MSKNKIWELIAKKLSGEASIEELSELENLLRADPEMHYPMQTVADLWHHATPDTEDAHQAFAKHAERMRELGMDIEPDQPFASPFPSSKKKYTALSFALLALLAIGYFTYPLLFPADKLLVIRANYLFRDFRLVQQLPKKCVLLGQLLQHSYNPDQEPLELPFFVIYLTEGELLNFDGCELLYQLHHVF